MKPLDPRLFRSARSTAPYLAVSVVLGAVTAVLVVAQAALMATALARVIERRGADGLTPPLVALAAVVAARATTAWARDVVGHRASAMVKSQLRRQIVARAVDLTADPTQTTRRAEVASLAGSGLDALDGYFANYLPQLVLAVVVPLVVLLQLVRTDLTATVTVVLTLPLIPVFMVLVGFATESANAKRWSALERLSHHFLDVVEGMPTLRSFGRGRAQGDLVRASTDRYRSTTMATLRVAFLSSLILEVLATLSVALVAVGVGLRMVDGDLDLRTGLLVILLAPEAYLPLRQVGAHYHASAAGLAAAEQAFALLDAPVITSAGSSQVPAAPWMVHLDGISVLHPGRHRAAPDRASLTVRSGEVVCITGASGSGKTSLLAVLLGLRQPATGRVMISSVGPDPTSVSLADVDRSEWHRRIAWVDQVPYVASGSLADNVRISRPGARDAEVLDALAAVGLSLPLDREVGDGADLSAGERRRMGLARALLRQADLLVLDEPTAGLDEIAEAEVLGAVRRAAEAGSAVVMVSHRAAAIAAADRSVALS